MAPSFWCRELAVAEFRTCYFPLGDLRVPRRFEGTPVGRDFCGRFPRFQVSDPRRHKGRNIDGKQNSKRAEHISRLHRRFLRHLDFRFQIPKLARFLISDFRLRISDPRMPGAPRQRFQISDFRFQTSRARSDSVQISDFRSQSGAGGCGISTADLRFQNSDPRMPPQDAGVSELSVPYFRMQNSDTRLHQEVSVRGPRRRPDNIGQIPMENLLSPVLLRSSSSSSSRTSQLV